MNYNSWNIKDLLDAQMQITIEIASRVKTVEQMDNNFHTYFPNGKSEDYQTIIETGVELLRKGITENNPS